MLVSYRWLARHVDLDGIPPEELANELTLSTAEVEGLEPFAPWLGELTVGQVVERAPHPDADKLSVCTVELGAGERAQIVCGAPNVAAGQRVAVATPGTSLPGGLSIKRSRIRGVESQGMICSLKELALGEEHDGIWVLPPGAEVGLPVADALGMRDFVIEIDNKSLTHRPDLWGHRGLAGEVAAIFRRELRPLELALPATGGGEPWPVRVESPACPRYCALSIDGARPLPSPDWLRWLLLAVGQRPYDQIVDLSNFVMLDLGQPNHAFDRRRLSPEGIVVREARPGERMTTLDGLERALRPGDLLICSGETPVALAGIMGGEGSKVGARTDALLLEVATFQPAVVRRSSARLGLRTEASARFEKSLDPTLPPRAAAHFARLLAELQPEVRFPAPLADAGDWRDPSRSLRLRTARVRTRLGVELPDEQIGDILGRLGFGLRAAPEGFEVDVPAARATKDVTIEQDLVEEVGRIFRYANVPERALRGELVPPPRDERAALVRRVQDRLAGGARFHEVLSYSFQRDDLLERLDLAAEPHVEVTNPVAEGESKLRRSVLPSLLAALETNRRQRGEVRVFEIGKGYCPEVRNERGEPRERHLLALVLAGPPPRAEARFDAARLHQLHGVLADLLAHLGLEAPEWARPADPAPPWAHPAKCLAARWPGVPETGALLAELEPGVARALGLAGELASDVAVAELSIDALLAAPRRAAAYRPVPRFPGIKVDVAVALAEERPAAEVQRAIEQAAKGQAASIELFDVYRGESLGAGRKSLAWHVLLQSDQRTLDDGDGQKFLRRLERQLEGLGAELRKG